MNSEQKTFGLPVGGGEKNGAVINHIFTNMTRKKV